MHSKDAAKWHINILTKKIENMENDLRKKSIQIKNLEITLTDTKQKVSEQDALIAKQHSELAKYESMNRELPGNFIEPIKIDDGYVRKKYIWV